MAGARSPDVSAMSATAATTMYAADLAPTRDKLADWMCAWLGGPPR
jgi:truncated hemoglobin YjbI